VEIAVDEDVCLRRIVSDGQWKPLVARTGLRSLCMISIKCRYCNPLAASASFRRYFSTLRLWKNRKWAYETEAVDLRVF